MSADKYSEFYCLTVSGWQSIDDASARPDGWIRIYEVIVYQGSPFGRTSRYWILRASNHAVPAEETEDLEQRFPRPEPEKITPDILKRLLAQSNIPTP
jgi:hypothetical protein